MKMSPDQDSLWPHILDMHEIIITGNGKEGLSKDDVKEKEKCREKSMK